MDATLSRRSELSAQDVKAWSSFHLSIDWSTEWEAHSG
jgi:hypothetical protein